MKIPLFISTPHVKVVSVVDGAADAANSLFVSPDCRSRREDVGDPTLSASRLSCNRSQSV